MKLARVCVVLLLAAGRLPGQAPEQPARPEADRIEEVIVVTASRTEQALVDAPAAISVITAKDLQERPADGYAGIFRNVPGLNVTQMNAREIQVTARAATSSLATSQLVLLDGRTLYLDFFGFVMWDFLPVDVSEIRQIEVVRGPGSAVWGANAMSGVINLITKRPEEMEGTSIVLGAGERGTFLGNVIHAGTRDLRAGRPNAAFLGYKVSAGFYHQEPYARPRGWIAGTRTLYPDFENEGTRQTRIDLRTDWNVCGISPAGCGSFSVSAGHAGTDGLVHSGIGPFDLRGGAAMRYGKAEMATGAGLHVSGFVNLLNADSTNLLAVGVDGRPIPFSFATNTAGLEASNALWAGRRHHVSYGLSARRNEFDLSIAPRGRRRDEYGVYLQEDVPVGRARWVIGTRLDRRDPMGTVVSPRAAFLFSPAADHVLRLSYGRSYRAPSAINNDLDTTILTSLPLPAQEFAFATRAIGNRSLREERMDAWELGFSTSSNRRATISMSVYRNRSSDVIDFHASAFYDSTRSPAGWPLPPQFLDHPPFLRALPSEFSYRNVGEITNQGLEVALGGHPSGAWSWFANYSYQDAPVVSGIPADEINVPPTNRVNAGASWKRGAFFVNATASYQSEAIWRDVLDTRYWGPTQAFTSWNLGAGTRLSERTTLSLSGTNLLNRKIQQHVFGDIIARKVTLQARFVFRKRSLAGSLMDRQPPRRPRWQEKGDGRRAPPRRFPIPRR